MSVDIKVLLKQSAIAQEEIKEMEERLVQAQKVIQEVTPLIAEHKKLVDYVRGMENRGGLGINDISAISGVKAYQ